MFYTQFVNNENNEYFIYGGCVSVDVCMCISVYVHVFLGACFQCAPGCPDSALCEEVGAGREG